MTILNESGVADTLSPLHALSGLAKKLPGAVIAVIGTRAEAFLAQSLDAAIPDRSPAIRRSPRVVFVVLDPADPPEGGRIAARLIAEAAGISGARMMLLVAGRSAELLGVDAEFEARLAARRLDIPAAAVRLDPAGDSPGSLSTDLEDRALATLVGLCPTGTSENLELAAPAPKRGGLLGNFLGRGREETHAGRRRAVVLLGSSGEELADELERVGVEVAGSVPGPDAATLPAIGEGTVVALTDPHLTAASRAAEERGAELVRTLTPIGVDGTARFIQDVATAVGTVANELGRAREAWEEMEHLRNRVRGTRIFFAGDTGYEIPLARFLADAGAVVLEVGAPRLDRRGLASEIHAMGADVDIVEYPDWQGQIHRADETRPDVVITSTGLYAPLVAHGHLCRCARDFLAAGPHGYEGARRILEILIRTFERAEMLDSVNL
ncbi:MAG TPA: nitrogenase component 1 [Rubrobacteraceae bacterium]|nr:nitrogenase component 1 [Rubrobacteraceae bacterium]